MAVRQSAVLTDFVMRTECVSVMRVGREVVVMLVQVDSLEVIAQVHTFCIDI